MRAIFDHHWRAFLTSWPSVFRRGERNNSVCVALNDEGGDVDPCQIPAEVLMPSWNTPIGCTG
jgi:hypothetical protein